MFTTSPLSDFRGCPSSLSFLVKYFGEKGECRTAGPVLPQTANQEKQSSVYIFKKFADKSSYMEVKSERQKTEHLSQDRKTESKPSRAKKHIFIRQGLNVESQQFE